MNGDSLGLNRLQNSINLFSKYKHISSLNATTTTGFSNLYHDCYSAGLQQSVVCGSAFGDRLEAATVIKESSHKSIHVELHLY